MPTASCPARIMGIGIKGELQMRRQPTSVALVTKTTTKAIVPMRMRCPSYMEAVLETVKVTSYPASM